MALQQMPKPRLSAQDFLTWQSEQKRTREAMDMFSNVLARTGLGTPSLLETTAYPLTRLSYYWWTLLALYRNHWLVRKVVDAVADDMFKNWITITSELPPKALDKFDTVLSDTSTIEKLTTTMKWGRLFGGAAALIVIDGDEDRLDEPLVADDVMPGTYKGLIPFDMWSGIHPDTEVNNDVSVPTDFGLPQYYVVTTETAKSFRVHSSRIVRFIGPDVPYWEKQAQMRWGISVVEVFFEELRKRDNTSWNMANLVFRANLISLKTQDLAQMLSGVGASQMNQQRFLAAMEALNQSMSSQGLVILPEKGGMEQHAYSFSGLGEVYMHFKEDICAATGYPYSRLFGKPSGGLGTTNEGDEATYYDNIGMEQKTKLDPQLKKLLPIVANSVWGKQPKDFKWIYRPVRTLGDKERIDMAVAVTTAVIDVRNSGDISQKTVLQELAQQSDTTGVWTNITQEMIEAADDRTQTPLEAMQLEAELSKPDEDEEKPAKKKQAKDSIRKPEGESPDIERRIELPYGLTAFIENEEGSLRRGKDWEVVMRYPYGYLAETEGRDGDAVDCFIGPDYESARWVYVVHTAGSDKEDKLMIGWNSAAEAKAAFLANYTDEKFFGSMDKIEYAELPQKLETLKGKKITARAA
jgi:phage-related protein (TIGR01555 family)